MAAKRELGTYLELELNEELYNLVGKLARKWKVSQWDAVLRILREQAAT